MRKMKERQQSKITLIILAMMFLFAFSSCDMSLAPEGVLSVTIVEPSNEKSLNVEPEGVDIVVQTYTITLTKGDGTVVTTTTSKGSDTSYVIDGLTVGSWSMQVVGKNSAGNIVAELEGGPLAVGVQRGKVSEVSARIVPCSGNGTLSLSLAIEGTYDQLNDPLVTVKVMDESGATVSMTTHAVPFNGLDELNISLPAGWYQAHMQLKDGMSIQDVQAFYPHIVEGKVTTQSVLFEVGSYNIGDIGPAGGLVFYAYDEETELDAVGTNDASIHGPIRSTIDGYSGMKFFDSGSYLELSQDLAIIPNVFEAKVYVYSDHKATDRVGIVAGNYDGTTGAVNTHTMGWEVYTNGNPRIWWDGGTRDIVYSYDVRKDQWIHLKWVRDESAGKIRLFVDDGDADGKGADVFEVTTLVRNLNNGAIGAGNDVYLDATGRKLRIGSDYPNTRQAFKGYIADVKIYDDQENLVLHYPMKRYLEAAPDDLRVLSDGTVTCDSSLPGYETATSQFPFGSYGATETYQNLGSGRLSTENLVAAGGATDEYAPRLASVLVHNGYDDWFLPSKAEMEEMVTVLHNQYNPLSTFQEDSLYWTSTQFNDTAAYIQKFSPSYVPATFVSNNTALHVRPARFL
ncbi:hypothetical protein [uncultured Sphaerochaeta sp.]|uniref:hypothetical protein n=1 Tax=uncultured Sphaerochaeta sp. TaxID=886478 RepID=UPI002A0A710A|nr:hypothetical protein [uncultured Sphaerochaeta sp.]